MRQHAGHRLKLNPPSTLLDLFLRSLLNWPGAESSRISPVPRLWFHGARGADHVFRTDQLEPTTRHVCSYCVRSADSVFRPDLVAAVTA